MTPQEERNQKLAERMIKNLNRSNMEAFYCPTGKEAVEKVVELITDGSTVTWGGTATVRDLGIQLLPVSALILLPSEYIRFSAFH